jgi:rare lipoprotein A
MLLNNRSIAISLPMLLALAACGGSDATSQGLERVSSTPVQAQLPPDEANAKIGQPYEIKGESYTPEDKAQYDEVGYGSWYGAEAGGRQTSNGETFNPAGISAAHKTLPMPSYVEVTNLDTGKTILARINDRGPFADNRIIDLSQGAAQQLGVEGPGTFPVRVRRVNPPDQEKDVLRQGQRAAERIDTPASLLAVLRKHLPGGSSAKAVEKTQPVYRPAPKDATVDVAPQPSGGDRFVVEDGTQRRAPAPRAPVAPPVATSVWLVQIASFADQGRAKTLASKVGGQVQNAGRVYRVVTGPYESEDTAQTALRGLVAKGYRDARITR